MESKKLDTLIRGKNLNFLIGSGASVPLYPSLSFGEGYPTFEEVVSHPSISKNAKVFRYCTQKIGQNIKLFLFSILNFKVSKFYYF